MDGDPGGARICRNFATPRYLLFPFLSLPFQSTFPISNFQFSTDEYEDIQREQEKAYS